MRLSKSWRSILCFLAIAFGLTWLLGCTAWCSALGLPYPMNVVCLFAMGWGPAIGALVATRFVLHESWRTTTADRLGHKRYYVWAWFLPAAGTLLTAGLTVAFRIADFDPDLPLVRQQIDSSGVFPLFPLRLQLPIGAALAARAGFVVIAAPLLNAPSLLGEELGWRGFLLPRLAIFLNSQKSRKIQHLLNAVLRKLLQYARDVIFASH